ARVSMPGRTEVAGEPGRHLHRGSGCVHRGQELLDLGDARYASRDDDLLVDDEGGGGHDAVPDDRGEVGDLLDGDVEPELVDGLPGGAFEVDAVPAAGAEDLDDHDCSFRGCGQVSRALNR